MKTLCFYPITFSKMHLRCVLALIFTLYTPFQVMAATQSSVQNFYVQMGLGIGLGLESYAAQAADAASENDIALHFTGRAHVGISNIMEVEWQHQIASKTSASDNYSFDLLLYKFNPFPGDYNTDSEPFYFVFGNGDIQYTVQKGLEWKGDAKVIGMEWAIMSYRHAYRIGIKRITSTDTSTTATSEKARMILIDFSVAIGY